MDIPFYIQLELYTDILQEYGNWGYEEKERHTCYLHNKYGKYLERTIHILNKLFNH